MEEIKLDSIEELYAALDQIPAEDIVSIVMKSDDDAERVPILGEKEPMVLREATRQGVTITIVWEYGQEWAAKQLANLAVAEKMHRETLAEIISLRRKYLEMAGDGRGGEDEE